MLRGSLGLMLLLSASQAPLQCGGGDDPSRAIEETPGQALYELAQDFKARGQLQAWRSTLERLIARYPSSRFAVAAKQDLAQSADSPTAP